MRVHLLAEIEDDIFHDSDSSPPADEDNCLLSDALEAILIEEDQGHTDPRSTPQLTPPSLVSPEGPAPMTDRELWMTAASPVCLTVNDCREFLISF